MKGDTYGVETPSTVLLRSLEVGAEGITLWWFAELFSVLGADTLSSLAVLAVGTLFGQR